MTNDKKLMLLAGVLALGMLAGCSSASAASAASGMAGFGDSNRIRTRKVTDHFYLCGDETSDAEEGICLTAARAALCAAHQANMIVSLILENE